METSQDTQAPEKGKKPYEKPTLVVYGTMAELTQSTALSGVPDGSKIGPFVWSSRG